MLALLPCFTLVVPRQTYGQTLTQPVPAADTSDPEISAAIATLTAQGIKLEWRSSYDGNNLGFNIYRLQSGTRTQINGQVIPGSIFLGVRPGVPPGNRSYQWIDRAGTKDSIYFIESVSVYGRLRLNNAIQVTGKPSREQESTPDSLGGKNAASPGVDNGHPSQTEYPAGLVSPESTLGAIEDQWAIAAQTALKISIKADGWYRVTQPQMAAAGFPGAVSIQNLSIFADGHEISIRTSKASGQLTSHDYIEFYGQAVDTATADTRVYYLITGAPGTGKRVTSLQAIEASGSPRAGISDQSNMISQPGLFDWLLQFRNGTVNSTPTQSVNQPEASPGPRVVVPYIEVPTPARSEPAAVSVPKNAERDRETLSVGNTNVADVAIEHPATVSPAVGSKPKVEEEPVRSTSPIAVKKDVPARTVKGKAKRRSGKGNRKRRNNTVAKPKFSHPVGSATSAQATFNNTVQLKERYLDNSTGFIASYVGNVLNGDTENYFGRVISTTPVTQTLTVSEFESSLGGVANLEVAIQGIQSQNFASHQVNVEFNGTLVTTLNLDSTEYKVQTVSIPLTQIVNGANRVTFRKTSSGEVCIIDYIKLTYPHIYRAETRSVGLHTEALGAANDSLRFSLDSAQSAVVDGFSVPTVRLMDITDPTNVKVAVLSGTSGAAHQIGYAVTVPTATSGTGLRSLYATSEGVYKQPAALTLNSPSVLHDTTSNQADMVIVAHKTLMASATPLVNLRQSQGMRVKVVDVEDVYDEFSYGTHGPQAIRDFLAHAKSSWTAPAPKYVILLGDADLDPRNYEGVGDFDLVPTKLVDATYNETASDDWLTDFDNDGIADIPVGRLPVRTVAEANLLISKIVSFNPANVPQNALLVADQDDQFHSYEFVEANDAVQAQLPASITVQRVNRCDPASGASCGSNTLPNAQSRADIIAGLNLGRAVVNYSGHGNVDVWTGANIFSATDARALTNGNKLSFVVVMDCLNGYFQDPRLDSMSESFLKAPSGGAVAAFASSGLTIAQGQHVMSQELYHQLYNNGPTIPLGDAIKIAKAATFDIDVKRTWIFFGDPSMKIR
jgi:hypothetical protein